MKKYLLNSFTISIVLLTLVSCENNQPVEPNISENQILIEKMKAAADSIIENTHVPGLVALVVDHNKGIDWIYEAGVSNIPEKLPMNREYIFRIGSNTKTFVITVLLQLVDEKKISLDDKLSKYFPEYPMSDVLTIAMLANMTSGIYNYTNDENFWITVGNDPKKVWTPKELTDWGFSFDLNFSPGSKWEYSNTNTIIIGRIIETITGNSLEEEIKNRIIQPLQLKNTGFLTSGVDFPNPHSRGYYDGEYEPGVDMTEYNDISWAWAAGSAYSNPRELQKYVEALVGGGLVSSSIQQRRLNDIKFISENTYYGLGILKRGSFYGHNGALVGFSSSMYHSNFRNATIIIYFNGLLPEPADSLFFKIVNILYGRDF
ncbi:MAG: serine hydrolase domain-containing protein [Ignavibacterium sp.]|nr:serine hydrolase domain-containing protein [Ignavibacterium sp.]